MLDRGKVIKGLEICSEHGSWHGLDCELNEAYKDCPYRGCETGCIVTIAKDALQLLKEQESEENRILKIVWAVLHSTVSIDTEADQDYVYELIRNQVRPMY